MEDENQEGKTISISTDMCENDITAHSDDKIISDTPFGIPMMAMERRTVRTLFFLSGLETTEKSS